MIAEAQRSYYDAQDTVTDREGNFTIPGITGGLVNPLAKIKEPLFTIFKPGYEAYKARRIPSAGDDGRSVFQFVRLIDIERKTLGLKPRYPRKGNAQQ